MWSLSRRLVDSRPVGPVFLHRQRMTALLPNAGNVRCSYVNPFEPNCASVAIAVTYWDFSTSSDDNTHNLRSCLFLNTQQKPRKLCKFFCISFELQIADGTRVLTPIEFNAEI